MKGLSPTSYLPAGLKAIFLPGLNVTPSKMGRAILCKTASWPEILQRKFLPALCLFAIAAFFVLAATNTARSSTAAGSQNKIYAQSPDEKAFSREEKTFYGLSNSPGVSAALNPAFAPPVVNYKDIPVGSYIVDMGSATQTTANGLKPYGMVYDLVTNHQVPVDWVISPTKAKDGTDFSSSTKSYRGGPFVIRAEFITPAVVTAINTWKTAGAVVDGPTASVISNVPVAYTLTSMPRSVIDTTNTAIVTAYYTAAGIPSSAYSVKLPSALNSCDDLYSMPHGDPTWTNHGNLVPFTTTNKGYLWVACHAVSVLENVNNPATPANPDMNFLSETGLVNYLSHNDGSPPYNYQSLAASDAVMQFIGILDSATQVGSEQIYLPKIGGAWRPTTTVAVWDPTHADVPARSPGEAAVIAYGRAFGGLGNGMVMYEGGHTHAGTTTAQIAAQRAYFNFFLLAGKERGINVEASIPTILASGASASASGTVSGGSSSYSYLWTSSCGGSFSNPTALNATFNAPAVTVNTQCVIRLTVTDSCGRKSFSAVTTLIAPPPTITLTKISNGAVGSFEFSGTNGFGTQTIVTATPGVGVAGAKKTLADASSPTIITETIPDGYVLDSIVCTGLGTGGQALVDLPAGAVALDALATVAGSNITCTFTNTAVPDISLDKSHTGSFILGNPATYSFKVTNVGKAPTSGTITFTDNLPTGLTVNGGAAGAVSASGVNGANWTCNSDDSLPQIITCQSSTSISNISGSNTSIFGLSVNVGMDAPVGIDSVINSADVSGGGDVNTGNNSDIDVASVADGVPNVTLIKSCTAPIDCVDAPQVPGTDLTYLVVFSNTGGLGASDLVIVDKVPDNSDFKLSSAAVNTASTGLAFVVEYSNDYDPLNPLPATWGYVPMSGGGGAPSGYDRDVKAVRWRVTAGTLSNTAPDNTGDVSFITRIR